MTTSARTVPASRLSAEQHRAELGGDGDAQPDRHRQQHRGAGQAARAAQRPAGRQRAERQAGGDGRRAGDGGLARHQAHQYAGRCAAQPQQRDLTAPPVAPQRDDECGDDGREYDPGDAEQHHQQQGVQRILAGALERGLQVVAHQRVGGGQLDDAFDPQGGAGAVRSPDGEGVAGGDGQVRGSLLGQQHPGGGANQRADLAREHAGVAGGQGQDRACPVVRVAAGPVAVSAGTRALSTVAQARTSGAR